MQTLSFELQTGIIRDILDISDISILSEIKDFLQKKQTEKYTLSSIQMKFLKNSEKEANEGLLIDNEEVFNDMEEWISKK